MVDLCYFKLLEYLEDGENVKIEILNTQKNTTFTLFKNDKTAPLPINAKFDNYDISLKYISDSSLFVGYYD